MKIKENLLSETVSKTENHVLLVMLNERSEMKHLLRRSDAMMSPHASLFLIIVVPLRGATTGHLFLRTGTGAEEIIYTTKSLLLIAAVQKIYSYLYSLLLQCTGRRVFNSFRC